MTERQRKFCYFCSEGESVEDAAEMAGFKNKGIAKKLLEKPEIQKEIERYKGNSGDVGIEEEIISFLTQAMRGQGSDDMRIRLRAAEMLSKRMKVFDKDNESENERRVLIVDDIP
ncbi:terminase small subunit [Chakrabartyella piscis]|uniref:terminase small subunit n=1 Tax=Chakrabartyella piscis TaxID=2918914 RepID=UPI0029584F82|nr:terminase small subunit [Chakrabartyella piscis]